MKRKTKTILIITGIVLLVLIGLTFFILSPWTNFKDCLYDENGEKIEGSISEKIFLDINNTKLGMIIKAESVDKPVLLFLSGGPGIPEYLLEYMYPSGLEKDFIVCYLEYRGTSLSYSSDVSPETMTTEQYLSDVNEVTEYLKDRFDREKVYLMAHSFGTYMGIKTASLHPENYYAYIAMSQITDEYKSETIAFDYMLEEYKKAGNTSMVNALENCRLTESQEKYDRYFRLYRDKAMHELGVGTCRDMNSVITKIFFPSLRCTAYTPAERINIWIGKNFAFNTQIQADVLSYNSFEDITEIAIPVYFFGGLYDYTCCYSLQKEYFAVLSAPEKEFYTFENSAHSPLFEEPEKAREILAQIVEKTMA